MSKTIEMTVFEFDELSDSAKEIARDWFRQGALDYEWWDSTYEDAANVGLKLTSFDLDRNRHAEGKFERYAEDCARRIIADHGNDCETFKTATTFLKERAALVAKHANPESSNGLTYDGDNAIEDCESEFLKSILEDYSISLQKECEYLLSNAQVDESIIANSYTFTEDGNRF